MRVSYTSPELAVIDDFLPPDEMAAFWTYFQNTEFQYAHTPVVKGVWHVDDGHPLLGPQLIWPSRPVEQLLPPGVTMPQLGFNQFLVPTGEIVDRVLDAIKAQAKEHPEIVGAEFEKWIGILAQLQVYPANSGLSWHQDLDVYTGAFTYYAHPRWNAQWGGELLVLDPAARARTRALEKRRHYFSNDDVSDELMRSGIGRFISAQPNRLVLLAGTDLHAVTKVHAAAGHHVRASLSGFFISPTGVAGLVQDAMRGAKARGGA